MHPANIGTSGSNSPKVACSIPLAIQSANQLQLTLFYRHLSTAMIFSNRGKRLSRLTALLSSVRRCQQRIRQTSGRAVQTSMKVARNSPLRIQSANRLKLAPLYRTPLTAMIFSNRGKRRCRHAVLQSAVRHPIISTSAKRRDKQHKASPRK